MSFASAHNDYLDPDRQLGSQEDEQPNPNLLWAMKWVEVLIKCLDESHGDTHPASVAYARDMLDRAMANPDVLLCLWEIGPVLGTAMPDMSDPLDTVLLADGMEAAFLGIGYQFTKPMAVYSKKRALEALMKQGMTYEEAVEYFDFNVQGAYVGEQTPVFIEDENPVEP